MQPGRRSLIARIRLVLWSWITRLFAPELLRDLYLGVLGREPDTAGTTGYIRTLKRKGARAVVITDLLESEEFRRKTFGRLAPELARYLYRGILGREPDAEGMETYKSMLTENATLEGALAGLLGSSEFRLRSIELLAPDLVNAAYKEILGREPDPEGFETSLARLKGDHNFGSLLNVLISSNEFRLKSIELLAPDLVNAAYKEILSREPDPEGFETSLARLKGDHNFGSLLNVLISSNEFRLRSIELLAPDLVNAAYKEILSREPDPEGFETSLARLKDDHNFGSLLNVLISSNEFRLRSIELLAPDLVNAAYKEILSREPDPEGFETSLARLKGGHDFGTLLSALIASEEFRLRSIDRLAPEAVNAAYKELLRREPDPEGYEANLAMLIRDHDFGTLLKALISSNEFRLKSIDTLAPDLVNAAYKEILNREPDPEGFEVNLAMLTRDHDLGALMSVLISSNEFQQKFRRRTTGRRPATADILAKKTVFLHIPKTGGTTLHEALTPCFAPGRICPERFDQLHRYSAGELARFEFFSGHFRLESCHLIPGPKRIITMLRHPLDRLVSLYNFYRAHTDEYILLEASGARWELQLAREKSMAEFYSNEKVRRYRGFNNAMVRVLSSPISIEPQEEEALIKSDSDPAMNLLGLAKESLRSLLTFGILERYEESIELIFPALGLPAPAAIKPRMVLKEMMSSDRGMEVIEPQACDDRTRDVIAPLIEADLALYVYANELFEERVEACRG